MFCILCAYKRTNCAAEFTDLSLTDRKRSCFLDLINLYAGYMHVATVNILFFCKMFFFLLTWPLTMSKEKGGRKCRSERFGKFAFSGLAFWLRQDWYRILVHGTMPTGFYFFALKYDSLPVVEFPVAWLCDTNLSGMSITDNAPVFTSD